MTIINSAYSNRNKRSTKLTSKSLPKTDQHEKKSIALVCTDYEGILSQPDRIGEANAAIVESLSSMGHRVTVYFVSRNEDLVQNFNKCREILLKKNIDLRWMPEPPMLIEGLDPARLSYASYLFLRDQEYDIIHFQSSQGLGYYSALSKSVKLDFRETLICIDLHEPKFWSQNINEDLVGEPNEVLRLFLERKSVELADAILSPNQYLIDWCESIGWKIPSLKLVQDFPVFFNQQSSAKHKTRRFNEIIFYGSVEKRNGVIEFCDALSLLPKNFLKENRIQITFLGRYELNYRTDTASFLLSKLTPRWNHKWKIISSFSRTEALKYIASRDAMVILPYRQDSMGYQLMECLLLGIPFIASDIPAFRAILDDRDHKNNLFQNSGKSISKKIISAFNKGCKKGRFKLAPKVSATIMSEWHQNIIKKPSLKKTIPKGREPLVSVCITHRNRPDYLKQCLESLEKQTYRKFEIILSDDASDLFKAKKYLKSLGLKFDSKGWKIIFQKKQIGPSANRNQAVKHAKGDYVLFMDDDNVAKPTELATFVSVALTTRSDIMTCACDRFSTEVAPEGPAISRWSPVGAVQSLGLFYNLIGDMNFFIKREVFNSLGGLSDQKLDVGAEDAEFLVRAVFKGHSLTVIPEALYWYRYHEKNLSVHVNLFETLIKQVRPYCDLVKGQDFNHLIFMTLSLWFRRYNREDRTDRLFPLQNNIKNQLNSQRQETR